MSVVSVPYYRCGTTLVCIATDTEISLDFNLVVQPNLITWHSSDAPAITGSLEDGDFNILSRNAGELRYAFIQQPNKQFLCFDRAPFKNTDFDDD
jgi:hypothetical protein